MSWIKRQPAGISETGYSAGSVGREGFELLNKTVSRLEEKAETVRSYYKNHAKDQYADHSTGGICGMNFDVMPELHWLYGYYTFLGTSTLLGIVLLVCLFRRGW